MSHLPAPTTGLDGIHLTDWSQLRHAYGPATDVPALLHDLAIAADPDALSEAVQEAWSSLVHQGTVYGATVAAVPFLAALATAGTATSTTASTDRAAGTDRAANRAAAVDLLASIAASTDEHDLPSPGAARAAVIDQLISLTPLLGDPSTEIRQAALTLLLPCAPAATPPAAPNAAPNATATTAVTTAAVRAALRRRWQQEGEPALRADLLTVRAAFDPAARAELRGLALSPTLPGPVRIAALRATVTHGLPWDAELSAAVAELAPVGARTEHTALNRWTLPALATGLHERGDAEAALTLLETTAARASDPAAAHELLAAADCLARRSRSAPARLLPVLLPLLTGDDPAPDAPAREVLDALAQWGEPFPQAVPVLLRLADRPDQLGDHALQALLLLPRTHPAHTPARLAELLGRRLAHRWRSLRTVHARSLEHPPTVLPVDAGLLAAVRAELLAPAPLPPDSGPWARDLLGNRTTELLGLLTAWGPAARPALPELRHLLDERPARVNVRVLAGALAAVADPDRDPDVPARLRTLAAAPDTPWRDRHAAATALHTLTGDDAPLLALLATALDARAPHELSAALHALPDLGEHARPLLPHLLALLTAPAPDPDDPLTAPAPHPHDLLAAAEAVRSLSGDRHLDVLLPHLAAALAHDADSPRRSFRALPLAARLGPAAAPATPLLLRLLAHPGNSAEAARALAAVHPTDARPAGVSRTELADLVLAALAAHGSPSDLAALDALAAAEPLTPAQLAALHHLATSDARAVRSGSHDRMVHDDLAFRAAARALHTRLAPA
ncbi:hypothetical protein Kpho02_41540 [Kitasatospora phosalacinea]|uniref:PBS lyase n=1 Tax=Kitasatospora phosalacinea TaxID=2065 RepID=A0A9W6V489_9ACTN|nr:hypothetical protein [Kitasatospora phosalacinea]GLW71855.1 hypothetical protein Kpho02_41540 [Kitasatospora phosalacinea]